MIENEKKASQKKTVISIAALKHLAIYLSDLRDGKGNLLLLGSLALDNLWNTINYLEGDSRYICKEREQSNETK